MPLNPSLIIIGADLGWEEKRLQKAAQKAGYEAYLWKAKKVEIRIEASGASVFYDDKNKTALFKKSRILFRRTRGAYNTMAALALLARHWDLKFADSPESILSNLNKSLFLSALSPRVVRPIQTIFVQGPKKTLPPFSFPLIIKPAQGRHGKGITLLKNKNDLNRFLRRHKTVHLLQPRISFEAEYRIMVVGGKVLGATQKIPAKGKWIANYAAGARFQSVCLPAPILRDCSRLCRQAGIDIGGVDLGKSGRYFYLLEINRCPEFKAFSQATGLSVADSLITFLNSK